MLIKPLLLLTPKPSHSFTGICLAFKLPTGLKTTSLFYSTFPFKAFWYLFYFHKAPLWVEPKQI